MRRAATALTALSLATTAIAQSPAVEADRRAMMQLLGITALRPGVDGDTKSPNAANYDESRANPHPALPDPLRFADGRPVRTAAQWWNDRRPQLVELIEREIYGRVPTNVPPVRWTVAETGRGTEGGRPVLVRRLIGYVDNAAYPAIDVALRMTVALPADATGPVPVLMMIGRDRAGDERRARLAEAGWGYAIVDPLSAQGDDGATLRSGIVGLANHGEPRRPDQWGALRAWAWAASRGLDQLRTDARVDPRRIGIEGVSRYGKAALVAMAFDQRFAIGLIGSSGKGGVTPLRRDFGEGVGNLATGMYHWMAGNFLKYDTKGVSPPNLDAGDLPVDSNALLALAAPRPVFVSYGVPEAGDALWLDQRGSFMATVDAGRVYRLLSARGPLDGADYRTAAMPAVNQGLLGGALAWRQHDGGHTDAPNIPAFLRWAARLLPRGRNS